MRHTTLGTAVALVAAGAILAACGDRPTESRPNELGGVDRPSANTATAPGLVLRTAPVVHYARVHGDGQLLDGTATSAAPAGIGAYTVAFPQPITTCSGVATGTRFVDSDAPPAPTTATVHMGLDVATEVTVVMYDASHLRHAAPFSLVVVCPPAG